MRSRKAAGWLCVVALTLAAWSTTWAAVGTNHRSFVRTVSIAAHHKVTARMDLVWVPTGLNPDRVRAVFVCSVRADGVPKNTQINRCSLTSSAGGSVAAQPSAKTPGGVAIAVGQGILNYGTWYACVTVTVNYLEGGGTASACGAPFDYTP